MKIKTYIEAGTNLIRVKWMFRKRKAAYTLVELMVTVAIIGIIIGIIALWGTVCVVCCGR